MRRDFKARSGSEEIMDHSLVSDAQYALRERGASIVPVRDLSAQKRSATMGEGLGWNKQDRPVCQSADRGE